MDWHRNVVLYSFFLNQCDLTWAATKPGSAVGALRCHVLHRPNHTGLWRKRNKGSKFQRLPSKVSRLAEPTARAARAPPLVCIRGSKRLEKASRRYSFHASLAVPAGVARQGPLTGLGLGCTSPIPPVCTRGSNFEHSFEKGFKIAEPC